MVNLDQTIIEVGDKATYTLSTAWTPIANITDIPTFPTLEADEIDSTTLVNDEGFKEFEPGRANGGEVEFKLQFDGGDADALYALFRVKRGFRITVPDAAAVASRSNFKFTGFIKKIGPEGKAGEGIELTVAIKISGKPLFTKGTTAPVVPA